MSDLPVHERIPQPFEPARAERTLSSLAEDGFVPAAVMMPWLRGAFGNSPFLARLAVREQGGLSQWFGQPPVAILTHTAATSRTACDAPAITAAMPFLRRPNRQAALVIAFADIARV